jgi:hypothetical protein
MSTHVRRRLSMYLFAHVYWNSMRYTDRFVTHTSTKQDRRCLGSVGPILTRACPTNPCVNGGTCQMTTATTYRCNCVVGFTGTFCETRIGRRFLIIISVSSISIKYRQCLGAVSGSACNANPCGSSNTCQLVPGGGYRCLCRVEFTGLLCEIPISRC